MGITIDAAAIARQAMQFGASQAEGELAEGIALAAGISPKVIVELGCDRGGTLYAWRQVCERVYGITWTVNADSGGAPCADHGAIVRYGDTHDPESPEWLLGQLGGDPADILVVDGDHHLDGVIADLRAYGPLVRPGGLIMMHDRCPVVFPTVEIWKLWPRIAALYRTSEIGSVFGWGVIHVEPGDDFAGFLAS